MDSVIEIKGVKFLGAHVSGVDMNELRNLGDDLKTKLGEGVILLISDKDGKVSMVAMATDGAVKSGAHAGNLISRSHRSSEAAVADVRTWHRPVVRMLQRSMRRSQPLLQLSRRRSSDDLS